MKALQPDKAIIILLNVRDRIPSWIPNSDDLDPTYYRSRLKVVRGGGELIRHAQLSKEDKEVNVGNFCPPFLPLEHFMEYLLFFVQ